MMTIRLPEQMEQRLSLLAKETHRTKTYYVKRTIEEFLDDQEDYLLALSVMERVEKGEEKTIPFEEILKKSSLEDVRH
jgi:RHH-type rel operon transcriptional repressor/antitoxin RelB